MVRTIPLLLSAPLLILPGSAGAFEASFSWKGVEACSESSPAFQVKGAPVGTTRLRFQMQDRQVPTFPHGGGSVAFNGANVPAAAFHYQGPCPPAGAHHTYVWTVESLDASGKVLAKTTTTGVFPPE
jgi:hypothetical protein